MQIFREVVIGGLALRFYPSDNGWMCGITNEMMDALEKSQRPWVGLTLEDKKEYLAQDFGGSRADAMDWAARRLKERNT